MSEWARHSLTDVLEFREGPGILAKDFCQEGVPLIRLAGLKYGAPLLAGCNFLDPDLVKKRWSQFRVEEGDVLLSTSASLGEVATVDSSAVGAVPYTGIIAFRPRDQRILPQFIPIVLTERSFKLQIEAMGVGSVIRHFGPSHLRAMSVTVPPIEAQRAIAEVLGAIEDKIAANVRLIYTASQLSRMIFVSLVTDGELIPLSSAARFVNGKAFTKGASGTGRVVIRIAELNSGIGGSTVYSDATVEEQYTAAPGDLLFAWSGSLTVHRWFREPGIINQHIFKVIPNSEYPMWLVHELLHSKLDQFKATAADKATTMGHIQRKHLDESVRVPSAERVQGNDVLMSGLWERMLAAEVENELLTKLRDTLLPQLMSGKLRIRDAEKTLEEVL